MGTYYKDIAFNDDTTWLRDNIQSVFNELNAIRTDFGYLISDVSANSTLVDIQQRYKLMDHCYLMVSDSSKLIHDPHHHHAEGTTITLLTPISGCDTKTVTSFVQPTGETIIATDARTTTVLHPDCAYDTLETFSLTTNPVLLNNSQWHMVESQSDITERIAFAWPYADDVLDFTDCGFTLS